MGLRITLDSTLLLDTPRGWDEAKIVTKRENVSRGLFTTYTTDLEFWGDGFDYIDGVMTNDYCQTIEVLIETDDCDEGIFITEFNGIIQLTQISEYNLDQRIIKTKILDESFDAKIKNNKSIKAFVDVGTSKNSENIQAATKNDILVFDPRPGVAFNGYSATPRTMFRVFDCFRFIIDYMTDGQVGFKSDVFSGKYTHWMLCNAKEFRVGNGGGEQLEVSFKELFEEMHKKTNLSFAIEPTPSGYTDLFQLRLEETSFFEQEDAILTLDDVRGILMNFNKQELFSHVEIGSKTDFEDKVLSYPPLNFKAFREENYTILGQCNVDKALNLVSKYIIDTNLIEDIVTNNADKYDKQIIVVITDGVRAIKYKEYDEPVSQGNDDAGTAFRLTDSTADFNADGVVAGDMAFNVLTGLAANVNSIDAGGTFCILDTDIFNNGDAYQIRDSPFNYNDPLTNIRVIERFLGGLPNSVIKHLTGASLSTFQAGITTNVVDTVFPVTIDPVEYDDDSTAPFFDTGGNYDTALFRYTVPSSGLYGFEARAALRLNGQLGAEKVVNGDFSSPANWVLSTFPGTVIQSGRFSINTTANALQSFLRQNFPILPESIYIVTFDAVITTGTIGIRFGNINVTTTGTHTIIVDYTNITSPAQNLEFRFQVGSGGAMIATIDNVSMKQTPRFDITQTIQRKSASSTVLQSFSETVVFAFQPNVLQRQLELITQKTFSTFLGERIDVKILIENKGGSSTQSTLLTSFFDQITETTKRTDFRTISVDDGGGDILPVDPATFPIFKYRFNKGMTFADFKALKDAPEKAILFSNSKLNHLFAWRNRITYDRKTGQAEWDLRSKVKINGDC